jgi:hypothetical protein
LRTQHLDVHTPHKEASNKNNERSKNPVCSRSSGVGRALGYGGGEVRERAVYFLGGVLEARGEVGGD